MRELNEQQGGTARPAAQVRLDKEGASSCLSTYPDPALALDGRQSGPLLRLVVVEASDHGFGRNRDFSLRSRNLTIKNTDCEICVPARVEQHP